MQIQILGSKKIQIGEMSADILYIMNLNLEVPMRYIYENIKWFYF